MYVYNVGQANCILVTIDNADGTKSAIFFDTGIQNVNWFKNSLVQKHLMTVLDDTQDPNVQVILSHTDDDHINVFPHIRDICQFMRKTIFRVFVGTGFPCTREIVNKEKTARQALVQKKIDSKLVNIALAQLRSVAQQKVFEQRNFDINVSSLVPAVSEQLRQELGSTVFGQLVSIVSEQVQLWPAELGRKLGLDPSLVIPIVNGVSAPDLIDLGGGAGIEFLMPSERYHIVNKNDASLVTKLTYQGKSILFTGDAPGKLLDATAHNFDFEQPELLPNILICPHHGSMSEGSYRWRGELDHSGMISIISSNPMGPNKLPERSLEHHPLMAGSDFWPHAIAYYSRLRGLCCRWTFAPVFVTCCCGIQLFDANTSPPRIEEVKPFILGNTGIGYHVRIGQDGGINVAMIDVELNERREIVSLKDIEIGRADFSPFDSDEVVIPGTLRIRAEEAPPEEAGGEKEDGG
ncbi:MAG: hypothetical protein LBJ13_00250 [Puniceicoccales bacterium]|jgi:hypothetical protein|nr:hypothetical protein [Puniceicoccales bacterium]